MGRSIACDRGRRFNNHSHHLNRMPKTMPQMFQGDFVPANAAFAIVVARWNDLVTGRLLDGATATLGRYGVAEETITVVHVPGSFELPIVADRLAKSGRFAAVLCLGAVIQGETDHDKYINSAVAAGLATTARETGIPVLFGVLTCGTLEQALDRAGGKAGNKGAEVAVAAIEMAGLLRKLGEAGL